MSNLDDLDIAKTDYLHVQFLPNVPKDAREKFVRGIATLVEDTALAMGARCYWTQSGQKLTLYAEITTAERYKSVELSDGQSLTLLEQIAELEGTNLQQILRELANAAKT